MKKKNYFPPETELLLFRVQSDCLITSFSGSDILEVEEEEWIVS